MDLVTIGITCFNSENTIKRAINCALNQSYKNKEIVIVNDGSSDNSIKIINEFNNLENIKIINLEKNKGFSNALNTIIDNANGQYISFFDDDDISKNNRVDAQIKEIKKAEKKYSEIILCFLNGYKIFRNGYRYRLYGIGSNSKYIYGKDYFNYMLFHKFKFKIYRRFTASCCLTVKKTAFDKVGKFDTSLKRLMDIDFFLRSSLYGAKFISPNELCFIQYDSPGEDKSHKIDLISYLKIMRKYKKYFNSKNDYIFTLKWQYLRFYYFTKKRKFLFFLFLKLTKINPISLFKRAFWNGISRILKDLRINS